MAPEISFRQLPRFASRLKSAPVERRRFRSARGGGAAWGLARRGL